MDRLQSDPDSSEFLAMLATLLRSAEFHQAPQLLADRVCVMVEAMSEWLSLREELFSEANEVTCQDDAALCGEQLPQGGRAEPAPHPADPEINTHVVGQERPSVINDLVILCQR